MLANFRLAVPTALLFISAFLSSAAPAQEPVSPGDNSSAAPITAPEKADDPDAEPEPSGSKPELIRRHPSFARIITRRILRDQEKIWSAPFSSPAAARDFGMFAAGTGVLIAGDKHLSSRVDRSGTLMPISRVVSGAAFSSLAITAGFYIIGSREHNDKAKDTGMLAAEALADSAIVTGVLKHIARRARPNNDGGRGTFFSDGMSFPSGHASMAWSAATVIAYEYHNKRWVQFAAYAGAVAVSAARFTSRAHFLSEVLVGSAVGFYSGRLVYKEHHHGYAGPALDDIARPDANSHSRLLPTFAPFLDGRTGTFGLRASWDLSRRKF